MQAELHRTLGDVTAVLRRIMRFLLQANVLLALGAMSLVATTCLLDDVKITWVGAMLAALAVLAVYNLDRLADDSPAEGTTTPIRAEAVRRHQKLLWVVVGCSLALLLTLAATSGAVGSHKLQSVVWAIAFPLTGVLYVIPVLPFHRIRRLKDIPYLKAFYVPGAWCIFIGHAAIYGDVSTTGVVIFFIFFMMMRGFASGYLGDIRDLTSDRAANVLTLASLLGQKASHRLVHATHFFSIAWVLLGVSSGWAPIQSIGLIAPCFVGFVLYRLAFTQPEKQELWLELYDLEYLFFAPSVALASVLFL